MTKQSSRRVLIVNSLDAEFNKSVIDTLAKLEFDPVVLHDTHDPSQITARFRDYEDIVFAIVLLSDDEVGTLRSQYPKNVSMRPKSCISFEAGYLIGKLGPEKVVFLNTPRQNYDFPFDADLFNPIPWDPKNRWHFDFIKELKGRGFEVDANKLI